VKFVILSVTMKLALVILMVALGANAYPFQSSFTELRNDFSSWKKVFNKIYKTVEEEEQKLATWVDNLERIAKHNLMYDLNLKTYRMEMNHFGDMNATEYKTTMNGYRRDLKKLKFNPHGAMFLESLNNVTLPSEVDWRDEGYVTPVKDQGQCGSCWSFSTTGSLEGQMKRKTGKLVSLSEQNLVDCSGPEGNQGCNGGLMDSAFDYVKINGGIDTEESYPYEGVDNQCRFNKSTVGGEDVGYVDIPEKNEHALKVAVATQGPVSVAIDASHSSFQFYSQGVYNEPECDEENLDHGVLVVGYGTDQVSGHRYWLVKNSWGTVWGDQGYIKMSRGRHNQCGIASSASYPLV